MADKKGNPPIPWHHKQWFEQLTLAFANGDVALMSCLDAKTAEPRSVICIVQRENGGEFQFIPIGHLCPEPDPFDAYIPPEITQSDEDKDEIDEIGQTTKRTLN